MCYTTNKENASENDSEYHVNCFGVDFQGNFFKRSVIVYAPFRFDIFWLLDIWNFQGGVYRMIDGSFLPIHHYKFDVKISKQYPKRKFEYA